MNRRHREWRKSQPPEVIARLERQDAEMLAASTSFYCSWGRHRTFPPYQVEGRFEHGTMCTDCQWKIVENVRSSLFIPEMTAGIWRQEREKFEAQRAERHRLAELSAKAPGIDPRGMVYYIRINGQIKIGYTSNLAQRSRHYPPGSELLAFEPGTPQTERERHQDFSRDLARGREWFSESARLREHIAKLVEVYGIPSQLMHRYTEHG